MKQPFDLAAARSRARREHLPQTLPLWLCNSTIFEVGAMGIVNMLHKCQQILNVFHMSSTVFNRE